MRFFSASSGGTKGPSADSQPPSSPSIQESSPGEETPPTSLASLLDLEKILFNMSAYSRTPRGLAAVCIFWVVFLVVVVCVSILLTSWETRYGGIEASSMAASHAEKRLDGWTNRRLYCYPPQLCGESSNIFMEGRSSLKFEAQMPKAWRYPI